MHKIAKQAGIVKTLLTRQNQNWNTGMLLPGQDWGWLAKLCKQARTTPAQPLAWFKSVLAPSVPLLPQQGKEMSNSFKFSWRGRKAYAFLFIFVIIIIIVVFERTVRYRALSIHACFNIKTSDLQKSLLPERKKEKTYSQETTTDRHCRDQSKITRVKGQDDTGNINYFMLISSQKRPLKKQKQENLGLSSQSNEKTAYMLYSSYTDSFMNYTHLTTKAMPERPSIAD